MNLRISRALPPGGLRSRQWTLPGRAPICLGRAGDACALDAAERVGNTLYGARVYVELGRRLGTLMPPARAARIRSVSLSFTLGPL